MSANQFVQMASLVGLVPMYCFTMGNIHSMKLGPSKAIKIGLKDPNMQLKEIQATFVRIFDELKGIWGNLVTMAVLENVLCEISRSYNETVKCMHHSSSSGNTALSVICNPTSFKESQAKDIYFYDDARRNMQNVFFVTSGSCGGTCLRPCLLMRDARNWDVGSQSIINLTNWCGNKADRKMLQWECNHNRLSLSSRLLISKELTEILCVHQD